MASLSNWLAAPASSRLSDEMPSASWLDASLNEDGFVEGWPSSSSSPLQSDPAPEEQPNRDPLAASFAEGEAAGRAAAEAEFKDQGAHIRSLKLTLRSLDQAAMDALASELSETVIALCSKAFGDFAPNGEMLAERCQEAASRIGNAINASALHLHPEDISLIDSAVLENWEVKPDSQMERGGLRFESADGSIGDGPTEWRRAIALALRG